MKERAKGRDPNSFLVIDYIWFFFSPIKSRTMAIYYNQVFEKKLITVIMDQNWVIDFFDL